MALDSQLRDSGFHSLTTLGTLFTHTRLCHQAVKFGNNNNNNKFAQSNLERGRRHGAVAYVRRNVAIGYNAVPQIRPKSTRSSGPILKPRYLPHPWTRPTYVAKRHPVVIRRFATMHWTDWPTHTRTHVRMYVWTDRPIRRLRESLTTIDRCAMRATRPNNNNSNCSFISQLTTATVTQLAAVQDSTVQLNTKNQLQCNQT